MSQPETNATISNPVFVLVMGGLQGSGVIILNGISLILVIRNKNIAERIKVCFIGQIITDFAVGFATIMMILDNFQGIYCYISLYMTYIFGAVTSVMALLQTLDRFLILRITYAYSAWISKKKMVVIVFFIYAIFSTAMAGLLYRPTEDGERCYPLTSGGRNGYIFTTFLVFFCSVAIICLYVYIGYKVRGHQKFAADQNRVHSQPTDSDAPNTAHGSHNIRNDHKIELSKVNELNSHSGGEEIGRVQDTGQHQLNDEEKKATHSSSSANKSRKSLGNTRKNKNDGNKFFKANEMKVLVTMILSAGLYGICYIPMSIATVYVIVNWDDREGFVNDNTQLLTFCGVLHTLNSILNPLVYIWRLKSFRINIGGCCRGK